MSDIARRTKLLLESGLLASVLVFAGCLQIETHVEYHDDGSATITERLNFSRRLLDMAKAEGTELQIEPFLQREAALERMKLMGKNVSLVSHKVQESLNGSKESITVFKTPDLDGFVYVSPWFAYSDYASNNAVEWKVVPMYKSRPYGGRGTGAAGSLRISFRFLKGDPKGESRETPEPSITPLDAQVYRELGPVFREMLEGFHIRLTFRAYCPVWYDPNPRGQRARTRSVGLIDVSDKDLDKYGYNFFENEEIMLDLLRWQLGSADVVEHVRDYGANLTLPVFTPFGSRHMWYIGYAGNNIYLPPSRTLFDRFFQGKKLDFAQWQASPPEKHVLADFNQVGYIPAKGEEK